MFLSVTGMAVEVEIQRLLTSAHIEKWMQDVFHFQWCFLLGLSIIAVSLWWKLLNKSRLPEVLLYAVLTTIIMMGIDECGEELTLWVYPIYLFPVFPVITASNLVFVILTLSLTHQYFPTWKSFSAAAIVVSGLLSFVLEPAFAFMRLYQLLNWNYGYNFLIYISVALLVRVIVITLYSIAHHAQRHSN